MKNSRIQTLNLKTKSVTKDSEGVPAVTWGEATRIQAEFWPAGGQLQVQTYGDRINNMMNVRVKGSYRVVVEGNHQVYQFGGFSLREGDGLCIFAGANDDPDYRIIGIRPYEPLKLEAERI